MNRQRLLPDFAIANGDGSDHPFREFLSDLNIIMVTRVPQASHGPTSELMSSLVAQVGRVGHMQVRGFEIRSSDVPCATCRGPHVVYGGLVVMTICDGGGAIRRLLGVGNEDYIFVVRSDGRVVDATSVDHVVQLSRRLDREGEAAAKCRARAPPNLRYAG